MRQTASQPILLTLPQAASLMKVSDRTIRRWIEADSIPYLKLPSGGFRIPQGALLASLSSTRDLALELSEQDAQSAGISEDDIRNALEDD